MSFRVGLQTGRDYFEKYIAGIWKNGYFQQSPGRQNAKILTGRQFQRWSRG